MIGTFGNRKKRRLFGLAIAAACVAIIIAIQMNNLPNRSNSGQSNGQSTGSNTAFTTTSPLTLLTDPFLQRPTDSSVQVVWFTEFEGTEHWVEYGEGQTAQAVTTQLSRTREDSDSRVEGRAFSQVTRRNIWRHEATVNHLQPGHRLPYRVISRDQDKHTAASKSFTLAPNPPKNRPLKILLTSDHQLKPMTPANLQKVSETIGRVDAVFFAGDLVNVPDRASEWFDDARGLAFFPAMQGRADYVMKGNDTEGSTQVDSKITYKGGEIIQHAPLFPIIGNHEVMGRYSTAAKLNSQFANTLPRDQVSRFYDPPNKAAPAETWIADCSYNTNTYEEIFSLPTTQLSDGRQTQRYYALSFGDVRLVSLYVTQIWRSPELSPNTKGRYRESQADLSNPEAWGYGQHIFEDIKAGSPQYEWLRQELNSSEFKSAKYKIVMLHHPPHTLGGNIVPAFTHPLPVENRSADGTLQSVQYEYPLEKDYLVRDLIPLLEAADVQLVFYGHSHLWNRFVSSSGLNFLETSNVGNSYGAHLNDNPREVPTSEAAVAAGLTPFNETYPAAGDPNGLTPVVPTIAPLTDDSGNRLPYIASNDITAFTIFDTGNGLLSSYYFNTQAPGSAVVKFDEFKIAP